MNPQRNKPEQLVALLVCIGVQLHDGVVVLDELEQLGGVQLRVAVVINLQDLYHILNNYLIIIILSKRKKMSPILHHVSEFLIVFPGFPFILFNIWILLQKQISCSGSESALNNNLYLNLWKFYLDLQYAINLAYFPINGKKCKTLTYV